MLDITCIYMHTADIIALQVRAILGGSQMAAAPEQIKKRIQSTEPETEAYRSFVEESAAAGREYVAAANAAAVDSLKTAFALQNEGLKATKRIFDASVEATNELAETWGAAVQQGQAAVAKIVTAGTRLAESTVEPQ
jgi:hypothetical protein